jgi:L-ascorbate metabolism protein UlaG (beta-lactamase superfamily)
MTCTERGPKRFRFRRFVIRAVLAGATIAVTTLGATAAPVIEAFPPFVVQEGAAYVAVLRLDDWVADPLSSDQDLVWTVSGAVELKADLTVDRQLVVRPPSADWFGAETLLLRVCDPAGECALQTLSLVVTNVPDSPIIEPIPTQATGGGEPFAPARLSDYTRDPDGADALLRWEVIDSGPFTARVADGELWVDLPATDWTGTGTVRCRATNSEGLAAEREIAYVATTQVPVVITYVGSEAFIIRQGSTKIVIDALLGSGFPFGESLLARMRSAGQPFDGVSVALTTHAHYDHFDPRYVVAHLEADPKTQFVSIGEVTDQLAQQPGYAAIADRVRTIAFHDGEETTFTFGDATITAIHAFHVGPGEIPCVAYLIDLGGVRILHVGDVAMDSAETGLLSHGLAERGIDVALINYGRMLTPVGQELIRDLVNARYVIPMHFGTSDTRSVARQIEGAFDNLVWLNESMETWIVPQG